MHLQSLFGVSSLPEQAILNQEGNSQTGGVQGTAQQNSETKTIEKTFNTPLEDSTPFASRHLGPGSKEINTMLKELGESSLENFITKVIPQNLRLDVKKFDAVSTETEASVLTRLKSIATKNEVYKSFIGLGYYNTITPTVIKRNILENPLWYTQYTPYQAEISQGRLEALLNYQTLVIELTGLPVANASLLDEATAAAEAMGVALAQYRSQHSGDKEKEAAQKYICVADGVFPQSLGLIRTRAKPLGIEVRLSAIADMKFSAGCIGALFQYPAGDGSVPDLKAKIKAVQDAGGLAIVATDLMALLLIESPGSLGADIALGSSQRFGVPLGYGGPHAAFFSCKDEVKRVIPGRIIGVSKDTHGNAALRLSLQTREQHIRREKATSNICTAQVLLAVMASLYAVYHGPRGLRKIAEEIHSKAARLADALEAGGKILKSASFFDTVEVACTQSEASALSQKARSKRMNLGEITNGGIRIAVDESTTDSDLEALAELFTGKSQIKESAKSRLPSAAARTTQVLRQQVFNSYHSETEFLRYVNRLQSRDLSLAVSMIPLGSCTMKLNATSELVPVSWDEFGGLHPFAPVEQAKGYAEMFAELEDYLRRVTGFSAVSLQPNSGAQGEYAGLMVIREYHAARGEEKSRDVCLIPRSAHGTNAASAAMAGYEVVAVECDKNGNVDLEDVRRRCKEFGNRVAALMVTYPSTHGVFEVDIRAACDAAHAIGAQVYMDGANLNALVGLVRPIDIGADVCHINLHKTFCIPHGGGGPGMGPIACATHLEEFLPSHPVIEMGGKKSAGPVSAAPWGSASILPISWVYMQLMGERGLRRATEVAILNANYVAKRLEPHYPVLYRGASGYVAHECIIDLREIEKTSGIKVEDVAKRLMDYGYHAPTISWPVAGTMMIEPTESESKAELDRFCDAMILIRDEIRAIESGKSDRADNPLKHAPHTAQAVISDDWKHSYSREQAAYPAPWTREFKFWPSVGRVDSAYGDRNFMCSCS